MADNGVLAVSFVISEEFSIQIENNDIIEITLFEDIYNFCMYGYITLIDKIGHTEALENLDGGAFPLKIEWKDENSTRMTRIFDVYSSDPVESDAQLNAGIRIIRWHIAETILRHLHVKALATSWGSNVDGSTIIEKIVKDIPGLENRTKFKQFEETNTLFSNISMDLKNRAYNIKWFKKRCKSTAGNFGYLFYSNSQGINFVTIQKLIESKEREKDDQGNTMKYVFSSPGDSINKILTWQVLPPGNIESLTNIAGSITAAVGPNKKIVHNDNTFTDLTKNIGIGKILSANLFPTEISNTNPNIYIGLEGEPDKMENITMYNFLLRLFAINSVHLVVRGSSERYAGMLIDIDWQSNDPKLLTDKTMEGTWLVKAITHQFVPKGVVPPYRQLLVCMRPGYNQKTDKNSQITGDNSLKNRTTSTLNIK